jgi:hypothetical protein
MPLLGVLLMASGPCTAGDDMFWFRNQTTCGGAAITVRSFCAESDHTGMVNPVNTMCAEQRLTIAFPDQKPVTIDLLKHESDGENFRVAKALSCVATPEKTYLMVGLDNGGNCNTCETDGVLSLLGRWKRYGKRWFSTPVEERTAIAARQTQWYRQESVRLTNMQRD